MCLFQAVDVESAVVKPFAVARCASPFVVEESIDDDSVVVASVGSGFVAEVLNGYGFAAGASTHVLTAVVAYRYEMEGPSVGEELPATLAFDPFESTGTASAFAAPTAAYLVSSSFPCPETIPSGAT